MILGEQQVTLNFGSLHATVPVGGQDMENRPWKTPVLLQTQNCSYQLEQSRSLALIHTPRLCDVKAPDHMWLHATSKLAPGTARANPQGWQCAGTCSR